MKKNLKAVYENGVLRPLEAIDLREHQRVNITISLPRLPQERWQHFEQDYRKHLEAQRHEVGEEVSLERVREVLASIPGSVADDIIAERDDR